ncbi:OprD family porin [Pseudomonas sp. AAC]|uniref:OprD family porin n=1 Tax=Pseudomonas sp. AAC TaxID=1502784 RepID=UPI0005B7F03C|nr:OprD family porin [Pseudomonas sp. AAC]
MTILANPLSTPRCRLLGLASACLLASGESLAEGFAEDAEASLNLRNFYINRNFVDGDFPRAKAEEWTQSFILDARSGYTPGTLGLGVDVLGLYSLKLDGGKGTADTQLLPLHDDGRPADDFGRLAVAAKARLSNSELRVGEWMPSLPVLRADDGRSLPQTLSGAQLSVQEIDGLGLYAGQFRSNSPRNDASQDDLSMTGRPDVTSDRFDFAGAEYRFNGAATQLGLWHARLEDIYRQQYFNLRHSQGLGDRRLGADLGYFVGRDDGAARAGELDNRTLSLLLSAGQGGHTFYLGLQRLSGDSGWMRVNGTAGGSLANDSFNSSYDQARERSWQLRYDYDFAAAGVPGLTFMTRYIRGSNVHTRDTSDGRERGRESELGYVVQSGPFKRLNLRLRNASIRRDFSSNAFDEYRLIVNYPFSLL